MKCQSRRPIIFMHVPKTSGTAVVEGLIQALKPLRTVSGMDQSMFGALDTSKEIEPQVRKMLHLDANLPLDPDFVYGHFAFSTTNRAYPGGHYLTVLREPRVRLLSLWLYWRQQNLASFSEWGSWVKVLARSHQPFSDFLSDPAAACQTDNITIRMLLWPHSLIPNGHFINPVDDAVLLELARIKLQRFSFVDLAENPDLELNLGAWVGEKLRYQVLNETTANSYGGDSGIQQAFTPRSFELLETRSRLDQILWDDVFSTKMEQINPQRVRDLSLLQAVVRYATPKIK